MAYGRTTVTNHFSDNSDFSGGYAVTYDHEPATPIKHIFTRLKPTAGGSVTLGLGGFTSITSVTVTNLHTTTAGYVTVTFASADIASNKVRILKGDWIKLTDVLAASDLVLAATTDNQEVEVVVIGTA